MFERTQLLRSSCILASIGRIAWEARLCDLWRRSIAAYERRQVG